MLALTGHSRDAATIATNLRRLMARDGLTYDHVVAATGLDERTVRGLARGTNNPHARTLHKLAAGLGVPTEELFRSPGRSPAKEFDRATNQLVDTVITRRSDVFANWTDAQFDELYSRFGTGGALTEEGVVTAAEAMNAKRTLWKQISVILETDESELLADFVDLLYRRVTDKSQPCKIS